MKDWKRGDPNSVDLKGEVINFYASHLRDTWVFFVIEDVSVFPLKLLEYCCSTKNGDIGLLVKIKRTNVIQASRMVLVLVSKQDCIQLFDPFPKHLHSKIWPGINNKGLPLNGQMNGGSKSFVSEI